MDRRVGVDVGVWEAGRWKVEDGKRNGKGKEMESFNKYTLEVKKFRCKRTALVYSH